MITVKYCYHCRFMPYNFYYKNYVFSFSDYDVCNSNEVRINDPNYICNRAHHKQIPMKSLSNFIKLLISYNIKKHEVSCNHIAIYMD